MEKYVSYILRAISGYFSRSVSAKRKINFPKNEPLPKFIRDRSEQVPVNLALALRLDHEELLRRLKARGDDLEQRFNKNRNALHAAAFCNASNCLRELLSNEHFFELDARDDYGKTALYIACECRHIECAAILIESGGDANTSDNRGRCPLEIAARFNDKTLTKLLLEAGASPSGVLRNYSPFYAAVSAGAEAVLKLLEDHGGVPKQGPQELADRLHDEIQRGSLNGVKSLLRLGADPLLPYRRTGCTAIELAKRWNLERPGRWNEIIECLKQSARQ